MSGGGWIGCSGVQLGCGKVEWGMLGGVGGVGVGLSGGIGV